MHNCLNGFHLSDIKLRYWLTCKCSSNTSACTTSVAAVADRPYPVPDNVIHIGNQCSHISHKLMRYRGLVYCNNCGAKGLIHMRLLARQCEPPNSGGKQLLKCIRNDKMPPGLDQWPDGSHWIISFSYPQAQQLWMAATSAALGTCLLLSHNWNVEKCWRHAWALLASHTLFLSPLVVPGSYTFRLILMLACCDQVVVCNVSTMKILIWGKVRDSCFRSAGTVGPGDPLRNLAPPAGRGSRAQSTFPRSPRRNI